MPEDQRPCRSLPGPRRVLYFTPDPDRVRSFCECAAAVPSCDVATGIDEFRVTIGKDELYLSPAHTATAAGALLGSTYFSLLLIDLRCPSCAGDRLESWIAQALGLIDELDQVYDVEERFGFDRIMVLVAGADPDRIDRLLVELASRGVTHFMRERLARPAPESSEPFSLSGKRSDIPASTSADAVAFTADLLARSLAVIEAHQPGKRAICAAGGGITGIYFELGALKCLSDCLSDDAVHHFDMYFGISAGAVVTSLITAGYSVDELMAALAGTPTARLPALDLRLLKLRHLDVGDITTRLRQGAGAAWRQAGRMVRRTARPSFDSMVFDYADLIGAPFRSDRFEMLLAQLLGRGEGQNDFRALGRELYIGATDQDARQHVLFGDEEHREVPISRAVQASLSVNPAFSSVQVDGHYYEDGAVTRTANFIEAIRRGANLILVIDPFVPYVSREVGHAHRRGLFYNIDQDIRTLSYTRLEHARNWVLRRHPEVASYTFLPSNRLRKILSVNPMDHRPFLPIWRGAYLSTLKRIERMCHRIRGDLALHGIALDTQRAGRIAAQLRTTERPELADFFPDRRIELKLGGPIGDPAN